MRPLRYLNGRTPSPVPAEARHKTIPVLTINSPGDQTVESASPVTVSGTLTDALSGASGVTCDGVTATLSGGSFSCNIALTVGVNLVVVRGTDLAGNVTGDNFHLSLTGTLPPPGSLSITPIAVNVVVGGTQQFTVVDNQGRPRPDATWAVDNTSIATIDTSSSPTLTAVAVGQSTLTATVGNTTAQTQVNILSGTSLPAGTVKWSAPPAATGYTNSGFLQAQPIDDSGPDVFALERGSSGGTLISAFTNDGRQMWQSSTNDNLQRAGVPSPDGGELAELQNSTTFSYYIAKIDGSTGNQVWQYPLSTTTCCITQWAVGADGMIYLPEPALDSNSNIYFPNLLGLDGTTGSLRMRIALPNSISQLIHSGCNGGPSDYNVSEVTGFFGPPEIAEDGSLRIEITVENILSTLTDANNHYGFCDHLSVQYSSQLQLWKVSSDGTYTSSVVSTLSNTVDCLSTTDDFSCPYHHAIPGEVIPDGSGGSLASWKDENNSPPGYSTWSPDIFHVSDVASSGTSDSTFSALQPSRGYYSWIPMVLGENNTAFATDGKNIAAFRGGSTAWTYAAGMGNTASLIVSAQGGELTAKTTSSGIDTVRRFDPSGALTTDSWTASNLDYYIGSTWFGSSSSGSGPALVAYSAEFINLASDPWFAYAMSGDRRALQYITVTGFSQTGPNQTTIAGLLREMLAALPLPTFPGSNSCNAWLQSGPDGANANRDILNFLNANPSGWGHGVVNLNGSVYYQNGAVSSLGTINTNGTSTGVPSGVFTVVNDSGEFFNPNYPIFPPYKGTPHKVGIQNYPGNTSPAQATILLHELGHTLFLPKFENDFGAAIDAEKAEKWNDGQVDSNCRQMIEALPSISSLSPTSNSIGSSVTIRGTNFGSSQGSNTVTFNGSPNPVSASITSWNANGQSMVVTVPSGASTGNIVVTISGIPTTGPMFTVSQ